MDGADAYLLSGAAALAPCGTRSEGRVEICGGALCESSQWCRTWNSQWGTFRVKGVATWAEAAMRTLTLAPYMNIPGGHDPCQRRPVIARVTLCELCVSLRPSVALPGGPFPCEDCAHLGWWTLCDPACLLPLPPSTLPPPTPVPPSSLPFACETEPTAFAHPSQGSPRSLSVLPAPGTSEFPWWSRTVRRPRSPGSIPRSPPP